MDIQKERQFFADNLRKIRKQHGSSQSEFAELCGISRAYYGRIERGEHSATVDMCFRITNALGMHISQLFENIP